MKVALQFCLMAASVHISDNFLSFHVSVVHFPDSELQPYFMRRMRESTETQRRVSYSPSCSVVMYVKMLKTAYYNVGANIQSCIYSYTPQ
jgi:hypothetical protein